GLCRRDRPRAAGALAAPAQRLRRGAGGASAAADLPGRGGARLRASGRAAGVPQPRVPRAARPPQLPRHGRRPAEAGMRAAVALRLAGVAAVALLAVVVLGTGSIRGDRVTATFAAGITPPADDLRALLPLKLPEPPPAPRFLIGRVNRPIETSA